jgi:hypothetical protein
MLSYSAGFPPQLAKVSNEYNNAWRTLTGYAEITYLRRQPGAPIADSVLPLLQFCRWHAKQHCVVHSLLALAPILQPTTFSRSMREQPKQPQRHNTDRLQPTQQFLHQKYHIQFHWTLEINKTISVA